MKNIALITGGGRGIGLGIAKCLAQKGYSLALNGLKDESEIETTLKELRKFGSPVIYCQGNIALSKDRNQIFQKVKKEFGQLNVLINNAGVAPKVRKDVLEISEDDFDFMMNINQKGSFFMSQIGANWMIEQKKQNPEFLGCIVNITSISARMASINRAEYCMSKASLSMMSSIFAVKLSEMNIPVYEVQPGLVETDMTAGVKDRYKKLSEEGLVLEKRMGTPVDIGKTVTALVSGQIPYATGQMIAPDGGMGIWRL